MPRLKKVAPLDEFARTEAFKKADEADAFVLIKRSDVLGEGNRTVKVDGRDVTERVILLRADADVSSDIKKADFGEAGYGLDGADQMMSDEGSGDDKDGKSEAKEHLDNLEKCHGLIANAHAHFKKVLGVGDEDESKEDVHTDMPREKDPSISASRKTGDLQKGAISKDDIRKMFQDFGKDILTAVDAKIGQTNESAPIAKRKGDGLGDAGKVMTKNSGLTDEQAKVVDISDTLNGLKKERKGLIDKIEKRLALTPEEQYRSKTINDEIAGLEMQQLAAIQGAR